MSLDLQLNLDTNLQINTFKFTDSKGSRDSEAFSDAMVQAKSDRKSGGRDNLNDARSESGHGSRKSRDGKDGPSSGDSLPQNKAADPSRDRDNDSDTSRSSKIRNADNSSDRVDAKGSGDNQAAGVGEKESKEASDTSSKKALENNSDTLQQSALAEEEIEGLTVADTLSKLVSDDKSTPFLDRLAGAVTKSLTAASEALPQRGSDSAVADLVGVSDTPLADDAFAITRAVKETLGIEPALTQPTHLAVSPVATKSLGLESLEGKLSNINSIIDSTVKVNYGVNQVLDERGLALGTGVDSEISVDPELSATKLDTLLKQLEPGINKEQVSNALTSAVSSQIASPAGQTNSSSLTQLYGLSHSGLSLASASGINTGLGTTAAMAGSDLLTLSTPLNTASWADDFAVRMRTLVSGNVQQASLNLHPAELGAIEITLSTEGDETKAQFIVQNSAVKDALEASLPKLREIFEESGLSLADTDVRDQSETYSGENGRDADERANQNFGMDETDGLIDPNATEHLGRWDGDLSSGRVDYFI